MKKIIKYSLIFIIFFSLSYSANANEKIYKLETLYEGLDMPWDIDFLPNGDFLVSELTGNLKIYNPSLKKIITVTNVPSVLARSQGGLSDVELHPDLPRYDMVL